MTTITGTTAGTEPGVRLRANIEITGLETEL
jgi:hypothetical protein